MRKGLLLSAIIFLVVPNNLASAAERFEFYQGVRSLGMGGASVAVVNDETALISNPAALAKLRDYYFTLIDAEGSVSAEAEEIVGLDVLKSGEPQEALEKCNENLDRHLQTKVQVFPNIVFPYFGVGLYNVYEINAEVVSETNTFYYDYNNDYAGVLGFGVPIAGGIIKFGATGRAINRTEIHRDDLDPASTDLRFKNLASSGVGFAVDAGLLLSAPIAWLPTIGAVYRDIGDTQYNYSKGLFLTTTDRPEGTKGTLDVGIAISPILGKRVRSTWSLELRDVMDVHEEKDYMRRAHGGFEINYADALFFRGGWHQHFYTAGLEMAIANYQFQAATYGEDIGTVDAKREDRRYVIKFAFRF